MLTIRNSFAMIYLSSAIVLTSIEEDAKMKNRERNSLLQPQLFPVSEELITIELNEALETNLSYQGDDVCEYL